MQALPRTGCSRILKGGCGITGGEVCMNPGRLPLPPPGGRAAPALPYITPYSGPYLHPCISLYTVWTGWPQGVRLRAAAFLCPRRPRTLPLVVSGVVTLDVGGEDKSAFYWYPG